MAMHLNDRMFETHLSTPISQTFALIAGDCNTTAGGWLPLLGRPLAGLRPSCCRCCCAAAALALPYAASRFGLPCNFIIRARYCCAAAVAARRTLIMQPLLPMIACIASAASNGAAASAGKKHNILYIMADDLNADWKNDRLAWMPNLKKYFSEEGTQFENHVAAQPVCGPSRSSMLLGRYPHNTGYVNNADQPSYANFLKQANNTVGKWLKDAGYYTAFFGKYVNGMEGHVPSGWSYWGALLNTYDFYNATVWMKDWEDPSFGPPRKKVMTHVHQADFLGNFTVEHAAKAVEASRPFFISVTPVMPHWGTCYGPGPASVYPAFDPHWEFDLGSPLSPTANISCGSTCAMPISPCPTIRNRHKFDGQTNPRVKGVWNVSIRGNRPQFMRELEQASGHLTEYQAWREDIGWQNRSASLIDLDEMIGGIVEGINELGVLNNTVMFFTSDNVCAAVRMAPWCLAWQLCV
jgi:hypothetical protein